MNNNRNFYLGLIFVVPFLASLPFWVQSEYFFFAAYSVLQFVILSIAWNILGGYAGYVNFGSAAFFALGAYSTIVGYKLHLPQGVNILLGTAVAGIVGLGMGYITLRLKGVFFSIATLAMSVVLLTIVTNSSFLGGARGVYVIVSRESPIGVGLYIHWLYFLILAMAVISVVISRMIEHSWLGQGLMAIRDDELAAEGLGVPTLKLKLIATSISGALMGLAGTTFPYLITYVEPTATFNLSFAVNSIAMPIVGGLGTWIGPLLGAVLLGSIQQIASVTLSSSFNLLIVGGVLVLFVTLAPNGLVGFFKEMVRQMIENTLQTQMPLVKATAVTKKFGGFTALNNVDLVIAPGERVGLIGPNGSGKSTLVNCISGMLKIDGGQIDFAGSNISNLPPHARVHAGIARSFQIPRPFKTMTVFENIMVVLNFAGNDRKSGDDHRSTEERALDVVKGVGLLNKKDHVSASLTQVELRKLELARAMAANPQVLIADEALAGLSGAEVDEILDLIMGMKEKGVSVLMIEHIMSAVMRFSERLVVLVAGNKIADGVPQEVINNPEVIKAYLGE